MQVKRFLKAVRLDSIKEKQIGNWCYYGLPRYCTLTCLRDRGVIVTARAQTLGCIAAYSKVLLIALCRWRGVCRRNQFQAASAAIKVYQAQQKIEQWQKDKHQAGNQLVLRRLRHRRQQPKQRRSRPSFTTPRDHRLPLQLQNRPGVAAPWGSS